MLRANPQYNQPGQRARIAVYDADGPIDAASGWGVVIDKDGTQSLASDQTPDLVRSGTGLYDIELQQAETEAGDFAIFPTVTNEGAFVDVLGFYDGRRESEAETSVTLTDSPYKPNRYAAFARVLHGDAGRQVEFELSGPSITTQSKPVTIEDDYQSDTDPTTIATQTFFDVPPGTDASTLTLTVTPLGNPAPTVQASQLFAPDGRFGVVPLWYAQIHCFPTAVVADNGDLYEVVVDAGGCRRHLAVNGQPRGELFSVGVPDADREIADKYHQGSVIDTVRDLIGVAMTDHQQRLWFQYGRGVAGLLARRPVVLSTSGETTTYAGVAASNDGSFWVATRVLASGGSKHELQLFHITGIEDNAISVRKIVLASLDVQRIYLRGFEIHQADDGHDLILIPYQVRSTATGAEWDQASVAVYDTATDFIHQYDGSTNSNSSDGSTASPKAPSTFWTTDALLGGTGGHRYSSPMAVQVAAWNNSTKSVQAAFAFIDTGGTGAATPGGTARLCYWSGGTRFITSAGADSLDTAGSTSYRFSVLPRFTSQRDLEVLVGVRRAAVTALQPYNQFGATGEFTRFTAQLSSMGDGTDSSIFEGRIEKHSETIPINSDWAGYLIPVRNSDGFIKAEAVEGSHDIDQTRGVERRTYYGLPESIPLQIAQANDTALAAAAVSARLTDERATKLDSLLDSGTVAAAGSTATNLDQVSGGGGGTVTPDDIDDRLTFRFPRTGSAVTASNIIEVTAGTSSATIQFDLTGVLDEDDTVATTGTPTIDNSGAATLTAALHTSKRKVNVTLTNVTATPGTYTVTLPYTTAASQSIPRHGTLEVK